MPIVTAPGTTPIVIDFSDADLSGWQMPISIASKLQGFQALALPQLEFKVVRAGLTPAQIRRLELPETPMPREGEASQRVD